MLIYIYICFIFVCVDLCVNIVYLRSCLCTFLSVPITNSVCLKCRCVSVKSSLCLSQSLTEHRRRHQHHHAEPREESLSAQTAYPVLLLPPPDLPSALVRPFLLLNRHWSVLRALRQQSEHHLRQMHVSNLHRHLLHCSHQPKYYTITVKRIMTEHIIPETSTDSLKKN